MSDPVLIGFHFLSKSEKMSGFSSSSFFFLNKDLCILERERDLPSIGSLPDSPKSQAYVRVKPGAKSFITVLRGNKVPKRLGCPLLILGPLAESCIEGGQLGLKAVHI